MGSRSGTVVVCGNQASRMAMFMLVVMLLLLALAQFNVVQGRPIASENVAQAAVVEKTKEVVVGSHGGLHDMAKRFGYRLVSGPSRRGPGH
ncbi:hypothetical protein QQ045_014805 [Rhodiola kirilowii]